MPWILHTSRSAELINSLLSHFAPCSSSVMAGQFLAPDHAGTEPSPVCTAIMKIKTLNRRQIYDAEACTVNA